jgi:hypothetical protein
VCFQEKRKRKTTFLKVGLPGGFLGGVFFPSFPPKEKKAPLPLGYNNNNRIAL